MAASGFRLLALVAAVWLLSGNSQVAVAADTERNPPLDSDTLQMVLDRVRTHVETGAWRKEGWKDPGIERWLEKFVASIAAGTENEELKLPVPMNDVSATDGMRPLRDGALILGDNVEIPFAQKSIILADGVAKVSHAQDCIIVARSVAEVGHARRCLIVGGCFAHVAHDGSREGGSVVASRGWVDISHATGSHILAVEGAQVSHANNAVFINCDVQSDRGGSKRVNIKNVPLEPLENDPLSRKIEIVGLVRPEGALFLFETTRYFAKPGEPIVNESGNLVEALKGWKLSYAGQGGVTVFSGQATVAAIKHNLE